MPDQQDFRDVWGRFATGVSLVTTIESTGAVHGLTANGIASVSLDPLLVLVCVSLTANSHPLIESTGRFAINILSQDQEDIARYYSQPIERRTGEVKASYTSSDNGSPLLHGALGYLDCRVVRAHREGDHTIFIGEVDGIGVSSGQPLLFFGGTFVSLK